MLGNIITGKRVIRVGKGVIKAERDEIDKNWSNW